ncbi:Myzus persicae-induced lipase 1 [Prunus dulcis]|uniref:Myzus persicae-induced lipase 1 n=1 Tax=Prunus dulcis TaxID=3755 RepID=A0A4Y1REI0_PRUDU|nr:Myzus persicae-induced lipase 1 [Prunus dulcis]
MMRLWERWDYIKKPTVDSDDEQPMNSNTDVYIDHWKKKGPKSTGTKKCGCSFQLKGLNIGHGDEWKVGVVCGVHNHHYAEYHEGHSYAGQLSKEENNLLVDMSKSLVRPKDILYTIKRRDGKNVTTIRTIYNARHKSRVVEMQLMLCKLSDHKCVMKACKGILKNGEKWEQFIVLWNMLVLAKPEVDYERNLHEMDRIFEGKYSKALAYVKFNWLKEYKNRFVAVWADTCMHFSNTTSNRAESAHSKLKRQLGTSRCNFETSWAKIHTMLVLQNTAIKASFERSQSFVQHEFNKMQRLTYLSIGLKVMMLTPKDTSHLSFMLIELVGIH